MSIVTSRYGAITDAIIAALNASPTFADPVQVFDGPAATADNWTDAVFVGFDGFQDSAYEAGTIDHQWAYVGNTSAFETVTVNCSIMSWTGDITPKPARDSALVLLAGVETVLRTDPTLGIDGSTQAQLLIGTPFQEPFTKGLQVRIPFTVTVTTTLISS
jgi:hypothetical protein